MARLFTEGFEMGDKLVWDGYTGESGGATDNSVSTSYNRSGVYSYRMASEASYDTNSWGAAYKIIDDINEVYIRTGVYLTYPYSRLPLFQMYVSDDDNTPLIKVSQASVGSPLSIYVGGSKVSTGTITLTQNTWYLVEVYIKLDDVDGVVTIKVNGIEDATYSGDTKTNDSTTFNRVSFGTLPIGSGTSYIHFDDIAINDTTGSVDNSWCGDGHVILYKPNATGSATMLMGSDGNQVDNYLLVDDVPSDGDTTYVYSGSPGYYDLYKLGDTSLPVNSTIKHVWVESRAKDPDTGYLSGVIQTASGSYTSGSVQLTTNYSAIKFQEYTTNPSTGSGWTSDEIDDLQAGVMIAE